MFYKSSCLRKGLLCLLLVISVFAVRAEHPDTLKPASPPRLVNDFAGALWSSSVQYLENKLVLFDKATSNQIAIITVHSLNGYAIADYAHQVANRWGIGNKEKDNGVLLLVAVDDQEVYIAVGNGLEGVITDALCGRIIRNEIVPAFKEGNFYEGLDKGTDALIKASKGEYKAGTNYYKAISNMPRWLLILLLIVGINGFFIGFYYLVRWCYKKITGKRMRESSYYYSSVKENKQEPQTTTQNNSGGSSNEQFGGYHGGSFGGGGAGGKW